MRDSRSKLLGLAVGLAVLAAACGSSTTESTPTESPATDGAPVTEVAADPDTPAVTDAPTGTDAGAPPVDGAAAADAFFREAIAACNEQSVRDLGSAAFDGSADDPTVGVTFDNEVSPGVFRIMDSRGIELLVDVNQRIVTGLDGRDGIMPRDYLFVCPESYFPGLFDEEAGPSTVDFFQEALAKCNAYSADINGFEPFDGSADDPTVGIVFDNEIGPDEFRIVDKNGVVLIVDQNGGVITGENGPEGVMPRPYSFWCPPDLFVGTLDEGPGDEGGDEGGAQGLSLRVDGLGAVNYGTDPDTTIGIVTDQLGPASADSGWVESFSVWGTCPGGMIRVLRWGDLDVLFTDAGDTTVASPGAPHFFSWSLPGLTFDGSSPVAQGLTTPEGIGLGSSVDDLRAAYGADSVDYDPDFEYYFFTTGDYPAASGAVSGGGPTDQVTYIAGGHVCGE